MTASEARWRAFLLEDPATAARLLRPLLAVLVVGGTVCGALLDDDWSQGASFVILTITSAVCARILALRRAPAVSIARDPARIWALISLGFLFLALDEAFSIHERIDAWIHQLFLTRETAVSDRSTM